MTDTARLKVAWVTNYAAPYRLPVWEALGEHVDLTVYTLATDAQFAKGGHNRPDEWMTPEARSFRIVPVKTRAVRRGEGVHYFASRRAVAQWLTGDAVVIGGWDSPAYLTAARRARRNGVRVVPFYESVSNSHTFTSGPIAWVRRRFFEHADAIVTPGAAATATVRAISASASPVFEGFNAVDVLWIHDAAMQIRAMLPRVQGHRYLFLGRFLPLKNLAVAVAAFQAVAETDDTFTLVGAGELAEDLQSIPDSRIELRDPVAYGQLPALFAQFDTLVLPSTDEVWGLVVNEALAAGLHVVVSSAAGVSQSVEGMEGVFVADPTRQGLAAGLAASRDAWVGAIAVPAILDKTPQQFAEVFLAAIRHGVAAP